MKLDELINGIQTLGITGHVRPDGDCIGSTLGLYNYVKDNYPEIDVTLYLEEAKDGFSYMSRIDEIVHEMREEDKTSVKDLFIICDCSTLDRIEPFAEVYEHAKKRACIDHHVSNLGDFADVNEVKPEASSTCEVLYELLDESRISKAVAECLYTGIVHDTGVFKYSSTSGRTMAIAGKLMDLGIDFNDIIDNSFYKKSYVQNQILGRALLESVLFYDGKCIFSCIDEPTMKFYNVTGKDLGGVIEQLRLTDGVEVAIFLYQTGADEFKVSLRSKKYIDCATIAMAQGGGGHKRAAGFTAHGKAVEIVNRISDSLSLQFKEYEKTSKEGTLD